MRPIRLLTFSTLFPNRERPNHGVFVENRLRHLVASGEVDATVVAPVPFFPSTAPIFGEWATFARVPRQEERNGLLVHHPAYPVIPKVGMSAAPYLLYLASLTLLRRLIAQGSRFDAIDAHYMYPDGVAAVWLGRRLGLPVMITARGTDITLIPRYSLPRRMILGAIADASRLITVSAALKQGLVTLGAPAGKVTVLRNGVDTALFRPVEREAMRATLGLRRPTLISIGLLIERKGHHRVIDAMQQLPGHELLIVGEGPERGRLQAQIDRLGLGERVRLLGARPHADLPPLYSAADALVLASSREGWANVLLEAMACGTPVIASNIPGNDEVVQEPAAGIIVGSNDASGIADAVRRLFSDPPPRAATRAYAERFSWDATTAGQLALLRDMLAPPSSGMMRSAPADLPITSCAA